MINGKAKIDFEKWFDESYPELSCDYDGDFNMPITSYNALIIEFLDSVKIFINIKSKFGQKKQCERFSFNVRNYNSGFMFNSRQEATEKAIEKAVEIYNNQKS